MKTYIMLILNVFLRIYFTIVYSISNLNCTDFVFLILMR